MLVCGSTVIRRRTPSFFSRARVVHLTDCDAAIALPELGRFRVNLFYQRNRPGMVLRTIGTKIPTLDQLEMLTSNANWMTTSRLSFRIVTEGGGCHLLLDSGSAG